MPLAQVGIPTLYLVLMRAYNVPRVAADLQADALLRTLAESAFLQGLVQPEAGLDLINLNTATITTEHVDKLHDVFLSGKAKARRASSVAGGSAAAAAAAAVADAEARAASLALAPPKGPVDTRQRRLRESLTAISVGEAERRRKRLKDLLTYAQARCSGFLFRVQGRCKAPVRMCALSERGGLAPPAQVHLMCPPVTWHAGHKDPRLLGAMPSIGMLFEEARPSNGPKIPKTLKP